MVIENLEFAKDPILCKFMEVKIVNEKEREHCKWKVHLDLLKQKMFQFCQGKS